MQSVAAVVPMVRDDAFFLGTWGRCNGAAPVRENCQVIPHGRIADVQRLAAGCTVSGIPGAAHRNVDMKRWRLLRRRGDRAAGL
ncbi:hypothetical protein [uncultured Salipiger sp.]|uniref:hypothetical protein n=1 Tax=uncultured Salipiger sp. TaxID=499810 RepID=UPI0025988928|nr:hypothetical protein [uncultured Salipiger sp.]